MKRAAGIGLAVTGPCAVGLLRSLLPYYTSADSTDTARAVAAHPGQQGTVLWLGLLATVTLVPGLYHVRESLPSGRWRDWSFGLTLVGYLCLPVLLVGDAVLWVTADQGVSPDLAGRLLDGLHPSYGTALAIFVFAHVVGTTLIGVLCVRRRTIPPIVAWALLISQPLHFATTVFLGLAWLDLVAWTLTGIAMGWLAALPRPSRPSGDSFTAAPHPGTLQVGRTAQ